LLFIARKSSVARGTN